MPFVQMTTRRWMIAVAVAGIGLFAYKLNETRNACLRDAKSLATLESQLRRYKPLSAKERFGIKGITRGSQMLIPDLLAEIAKAKGKYERAARRPWLPAPPDPE